MLFLLLSSSADVHLAQYEADEEVCLKVNKDKGQKNALSRITHS
jgi:hypothetical protein